MLDSLIVVVLCALVDKPESNPGVSNSWPVGHFRPHPPHSGRELISFISRALTGAHFAFSAADSDGDSAEWAMEQEDTIEGLLCDAPSLLPTLSLSLAPNKGPQAPEGPALVPAATSAQTSVNQGKGMKVRDDDKI